MKRILCFLLCILIPVSLLAIPAAAAIFQLSYYEEEIYAGGILDLYAFPHSGGVEPFTYQWQAEGFGWIDLEDNDVYSGTQTNHLQIRTHTGDYGDFGSIPFQCKVTDAEGTTFYTPSLHPDIYPTDHLIPNMRAWGYGLYTPTLTNVSNLQTDGSGNYTAYALAGSKLDISCGSKSVDDKEILRDSEVNLTREIHITENGHTTQVGDHTTYLPYTIGTNAVTVVIKQRLSIADHDLGDFDVKTIKISTGKPTVAGTATANADCSLLRYTYNESQKLASIPKGTTVEILGQDGSYYQVLYNNFVGYVGTSLLNRPQGPTDPVIKNVDVTITAPAAGEKPSLTCNVLTTGCQLFHNEPVTWYDKTAQRFLSPSDSFTEGHSYDLTIWLAAKSGYKFQVDAVSKPKLTGSINGNLPPYIRKAYEQDPEQVIELLYTFNNVKQKEPEHTCAPVLVERVAPTCTEKGHEAYYRCSCGMFYADTHGQTPVNPDTWGVLPATGHTPSGWRITQVYHYKVCTACGELLEDQDHTGGTATCTQKASCSVCGSGYGNLSGHRWSTGWLYQDSTGHAKVCTDCQTHGQVTPHSPGPAATETAPQTCKDCGYILKPAKNHQHDLKKVPQTPATCTKGGNIEYYTCSGCSDLFKDADGKTKLSKAADVTVGALGHKASDSWSSNGEYHWRTCSVCAVTLDETKMLHESKDGTCTTCGYKTGTNQTAGTEPTAPAASGSETAPATDPATGTETAPATEPETTGTGKVPGNGSASEEKPSGSGKDPSVGMTGSQPSLPDQKPRTGWIVPVIIASVCLCGSAAAAVILLKKKRR